MMVQFACTWIQEPSHLISSPLVLIHIPVWEPWPPYLEGVGLHLASLAQKVKIILVIPFFLFFLNDPAIFLL
jgi:hypothetical protein